jgi:hypothetical protein
MGISIPASSISSRIARFDTVTLASDEELPDELDESESEDEEDDDELDEELDEELEEELEDDDAFAGESGGMALSVAWKSAANCWVCTFITSACTPFVALAGSLVGATLAGEAVSAL